MARPRIRFSPIKKPNELTSSNQKEDNEINKVRTIDFVPEFETSSPKKDTGVTGEHDTDTNRSVDLEDDSGYRTEESYNYEELDSSFLSPIVATHRSDDLRNGEFEDYQGDYEDNAAVVDIPTVKADSTRKPVSSEVSNEDAKIVELSGNQGQESDENIDAESTIVKVTQFIDEKRRKLEEADKNVDPVRRKENGGNTQKKKKKKRRGQELLHSKREHTGHNDNDKDWTSEEWTRLYNYLKRWKLTGDSGMMKASRLEKKFGCSIGELEIRVKTLRTVIDKKKREELRKNVDRILGEEGSE
ncbi:DEKNAAC102960 [Brettanomyces naardenensis]|uniref:DEKNAAC102960 n=1 Tax=Brettanomyces naardenensis TaxID=13370 RepID=A0A448YM51_BRENA|nr:DEKNAAC102960 [Brettanomyces naardenensis]